MSLFNRLTRRMPASAASAAIATADGIEVPAAGPDGFSVRLDVVPRGFVVRFDGWHERFDREEDAADCVLFGLSDRCRLAVTLRGATPVAWRAERREYGLWTPRREVRRRLAPFWRRARTVYLQNQYPSTDG